MTQFDPVWPSLGENYSPKYIVNLSSENENTE